MHGMHLLEIFKCGLELSREIRLVPRLAHPLDFWNGSRGRGIIWGKNTKLQANDVIWADRGLGYFRSTRPLWETELVQTDVSENRVFQTSVSEPGNTSD